MGSALLALLACADGGDGKDDETGEGSELVALPEDCSTLPETGGTTYGPDDADALRDVLAGASSGDTILLEDGTYTLTGGDAVHSLAVPEGVTLRSASGDASAVVLEGGWSTAELVTLGDDATLAEVTVSHAAADAVVIRAATGARVYGVRVVDPGERGVAVLPDRGAYADGATIGCVTVTRSSETCDLGIEGVQSDGSRVYGARIDAPDCDEPGIKFATGSRDTVIERSTVRTGGIVGLMLGDSDYGEGDERVYDDAGCADRTLVGHYGGLVANVFTAGSGIRVEDTCGGTVAHTSVWAGDLAWAFSEDVVIVNNLASLADNGGATATGNLTPSEADFADAWGGDLHLADGSAAIDAGAPVEGVELDIDGDERDAAPDVGADER